MRDKEKHVEMDGNGELTAWDKALSEGLYYLIYTAKELETETWINVPIQYELNKLDIITVQKSAEHIMQLQDVLNKIRGL